MDKFKPGWRNTLVAFGDRESETSKDENTFEIDTISIPSQFGYRLYSTCETDQSAVERKGIFSNIAVIKLQKNVPETVAKPLSVLPNWLADELNSDDLTLEFVGFGRNEKNEIGYKLSYSLPILGMCKASSEDLDNGFCYAKANASDLAYPVNSLWYNREAGGPDVGDFGSPALVKIGGKEYVVGVTSELRDNPVKLGISMDVSSFYESMGFSDLAGITKQYVEICGNGIDDDNNGHIDGEDIECSECKATFTFHNEYTNNGETNYDVYLVGSFNAEEDGTWILDDDKYKMTSDGNGTHTITINYPKNSTFEYKYHVKGWINAETGEDDGWFSDAESDGDALADFSICGKRYGVGSDVPYCGDGIFQEDNDEICDNMDIPDFLSTCSLIDESLVAGQVKCDSECKIDITGCYILADDGGIGNGESDGTRTSLPNDPEATNGKITIDSLDLPTINRPNSDSTDDSPSDSTDDSQDDGGDACSAMPLHATHSIPGALAILFGLTALMGLRRRKEC